MALNRLKIAFMNFKIYLDMDGVLVDLNQGLINLYGKKYHEMDQSDLWLNRMASNKNFFRHLKPTLYGKILFDYVNSLVGSRVEILTAIPYLDYPDIIEDKKYWIQQYISSDVKVNTTVGGLSKADYINSSKDILIDDTLENIIAWEKKGAIGIYHNQYQPERTFLELSMILLENI